MSAVPESRFADLPGGLRVHWLEAGDPAAPPVLLLHGWPTSSFLWRNVIGPIADAGNRVIAPDLPGFGRSDKPLDASYSFRFFDSALDELCEAAGVGETGLAVHDLGGPVGMHWATRHPGRVRKLALLNTLVFAKPSAAVVAFIVGLRTPGLRSWLTSERGLRFAMRIGIRDESRVDDELLAGVLEPFAGDDARKALRKAALNLHPSGMKEVERWLGTVEFPVRIVYGTDDKILPDVAKTMRKVAEIVPGTEITALEGCGHFLQEDRPDEVAAHLAAFFAD